jgi:thiamine phosphate phosphatase / amino-HMP aminohydrolase
MSTQQRAFILDFDGTITLRDTISTLFNFALSTQAAKGRDLTAVRNEILAQYSEDNSKHVSNYSPMKEERTAITQEIEYYRSLNGVETRSFERVSKSGLFRGISKEGWEVFGRNAVKNGEVVVRAGFDDFIKKIEMSGGVWNVVSVNFSSHFIRGVLASAGVELSTVQLLANQPDENGILLGPECRDGRSVMATSDAKLASANSLLKLWRSEKGGDFSNVVYIGDSGTDIECLTEEGTTGIVIAEDRNSSLMGILNRVGVNVKHIDVYRGGQESKVYWARDFTEIVRSAIFMS